MPTLIPSPTVLWAAGAPPKRIEEYVGALNTRTAGISIARMVSPQGWSEPGQRPEFEEYTVVLSGTLTVETEAETLKVQAGQAIHCLAGEWVRYATPDGPAEYVAVCLPAFNPAQVHRDE